MKSKYYLYLILLLSLLGLADSWYLTLEHYGKIIVPCSTAILVDCGKVLRSKYSEVLGIPLALIGVFHYGLFSLVNFYNVIKKDKQIRVIAIIFSTIGTLSSIVFMYLQFFVIGSICLYCTLSAIISFTLLYLTYRFFEDERKFLFIKLTGYKYRYILKKILFLFDAEFVHEKTIGFGKFVGKNRLLRNIFSYFYDYRSTSLKQKVLGINFESPIGLAAGFDYDANLTQFLPSLGFGFMSVGTITNMPYAGNPAPRLGRLPKSKSLLVNKGFKNEGADVIADKIKNQNFEIPVGISIGRTNSSELDSQKKSIDDIISAFKKFESTKIKNSYYELNISCPNLIHQGEVVFDEPKKLDELLVKVDSLKLKKPVFLKMPIDKSDQETLELLKIISTHSPKGVIFGNLQKDKKHPSLHLDEVAKFEKGYYSGKPTYQRSNELIKLAYKNFKNRLVIIGCGGVFSAEDAYTKIKLGASLVQLITGLVYNGPQLVAEINFGLVDLLKKDGYKNISQAIGVDN
ncbi:dihydroorotate dehydrogenase (quinone) [Candidatus Woesebacteria bacterium RIFCSPHIGHO2_01_FULL_39_32]|uniref:Dihydroorotate dehydrogenase (quinone) n=1 Tax=Candidatus Woesebacteria bacterium RIFCSPLOWO2_01_FULL_39_25 TaxID=1802521 RepID=A0A1F8BNK4_9BACT|nr:MAG: dihydroorotate dehydrogenase (quinone) [Candidatus Woesebacteria bacterium GWB1_37_5]OGM25337.1 MAG: dihydroorotate dehydrogenase (quinone) [Candidatus Woesebacteria bacterium RIFCSPHIGHO2_01_FULL_39_32]OGM37836.1 MAG: dihydroorotate dehydrogenase (quinone) [Candidatus Woesebacteria bacterium RIFCSPHIGHO2_12_FULL_38_11]OGM64868.1 MAG: dihydroorotate dehydrogenase (quinone) [Candidatus Woesebacteria bacterium RIFCSPLOWO2_01_FULL_39_25]